MSKQQRRTRPAVFLAIVLGAAVAHAQPTTTAREPAPLITSSQALTCGSRKVALFGGYTSIYSTPAILTGAGHVVTPITDVGILGGGLAGQDVLYMDRSANISAPVLAAIKSFVEGGGTLVTEFSATNPAIPGMGFSIGALVNGFFVPSGSVVGGNAVSVVAPGNPLATSLPAGWISGDPIGVFQVFASLDPNLEVVAQVAGTALGDLPVVVTGCLGSGAVVFYLTDFGDFNSPIAPEEITLLLNSVCFAPAGGCSARAVAPVMTQWGLLICALALTAVGMRRLLRPA